MSAIIRQFRLTDYAAAVGLWELSRIRVEPLESVQRQLGRDRDLFLVAEDGDELVGVALGAFDGRSGSVNRLAIAERYRRTGLASQLIQAIEAALRRKGAKRMWAWIETENEHSRALFAKNGFDEWSHVVTVAKPLT